MKNSYIKGIFIFILTFLLIGAESIISLQIETNLEKTYLDNSSKRVNTEIVKSVNNPFFPINKNSLIQDSIWTENEDFKQTTVKNSKSQTRVSTNTVKITFAGNPIYEGSQYYLPPAKNSSASKPSEGYFVNGSCIPTPRLEIWTEIYSQNERDTVTSASVHFFNMTSNTWDNTTEMNYQGDNNWSVILSSFDWKTPQSAESDNWINPTNGNDDDKDTHTSISNVNEYIWFNMSSEVSCDKIRLISSDTGEFYTTSANVVIDVKYNDGWHTIHDGSLKTHGKDWEAVSMGSIQPITSCRIKANSISYDQINIFEIDFCDTEGGNIPITNGHRYSFDIHYETEQNNHGFTSWYKNETSNPKNLIRRSVFLGSTPNNDEFEYKPFYMWNLSDKEAPPGYNIWEKRDSLWHDQKRIGAGDTGVLRKEEPTKETQWTYCGAGTWQPIDWRNSSNKIIINETTIRNIYFRCWWSNQSTVDGFNTSTNTFGINRTKGDSSFGNDEFKVYYSSDARAVLNVTDMSSSTWVDDDIRYVQLATFKMEINNKIKYTFDSNSIYELFFIQNGTSPSSFCNESYKSYLLFNIPDNGTLMTWDTDGDGLNDYDELFVNYTSPFHYDTDNDGVNDEIDKKPNIYTYQNDEPWIHNSYPTNSSTNISLQPTCDIDIIDNDSDIITVTWQSNFSDDNSWKTYQVNNTADSYTNLKWTFEGANTSDTMYWWRVYADDGSVNISKTFHFRTITLPDTVYVDDDYSSTPVKRTLYFDTIQEGIDAVAEYGLVYVFNGTYNENIVIEKRINLTGESNINSVINGGGNDAVVTINTDWVNITNFTVQNSSSNKSGICLSDVHQCLITNNKIKDNYGKGILLNSDSSENKIHNNIIENNSDHGVLLINSSCNNNLQNNIIENNDNGIRILDLSNNNLIYHNIIKNNLINAYDECFNTWDNNYPSGGNYWSDYDEQSEGAWDNNTDCIVDRPYNIPGGNSKDNYPLYTLNCSSCAIICYETNHSTVYFNASHSYDYDGNITSYYWDFGDGEYSSVPNPVHSYNEDGDYNVTLTITDEDGNNHTTFITIRVHTIYSRTGWNLIIIPIEKEMYASDLTNNITGCQSVSKWDNINHTYNTYIKGVPPSDFKLKNYQGKGYFIDVNQNNNCTFTGSPINAVETSLNIGWNLLGWFQGFNTTASSLAENIDGCLSVSRWNASMQTYDTYISEVPPSDFNILCGIGVFVDVNQTSIWYG